MTTMKKFEFNNDELIKLDTERRKICTSIILAWVFLSVFLAVWILLFYRSKLLPIKYTYFIGSCGIIFLGAIWGIAYLWNKLTSLNRYFGELMAFRSVSRQYPNCKISPNEFLSLQKLISSGALPCPLNNSFFLNNPNTITINKKNTTIKLANLEIKGNIFIPFLFIFTRFTGVWLYVQTHNKNFDEVALKKNILSWRQRFGGKIKISFEKEKVQIVISSRYIALPLRHGFVSFLVPAQETYINKQVEPIFQILRYFN